MLVFKSQEKEGLLITDGEEIGVHDVFPAFFSPRY
jgi:hypothetical protein